MTPFQLGLLCGATIAAFAVPVALTLGADVVRWCIARRQRSEARRFARAVAPSLRTPVGWEVRRLH